MLVLSHSSYENKLFQGQLSEDYARAIDSKDHNCVLRNYKDSEDLSARRSEILTENSELGPTRNEPINLPKSRSSTEKPEETLNAESREYQIRN